MSGLGLTAKVLGFSAMCSNLLQIQKGKVAGPLFCPDQDCSIIT